MEAVEKDIGLTISRLVIVLSCCELKQCFSNVPCVLCIITATHAYRSHAPQAYLFTCDAISYGKLLQDEKDARRRRKDRADTDGHAADSAYPGKRC